MKILFVINPVSGGKKKIDWETEIRSYFTTSPHTMEFYLMTGNSDVTSVKHYIERINPDKVVAVGGDGTVKMVAELIKGTNKVLGILPAGSANGMAKELNLPLTAEAALDVIINGRSRPIDAIVINGNDLCIHLSDMGMNAMLVKYFEASSGRGMWGYGKAIFKMLWNKRKIYATIKVDDQAVRRKAYMIVLANASKYGTGATINPDGLLDDGLFEVVVVRRLNFWEILKALITHKTFDPDKIEVFRTSKLELSTLRRNYFQVDGEYRGRTKEVKAEILPRCINVMLPAQEEGSI